MGDHFLRPFRTSEAVKSLVTSSHTNINCNRYGLLKSWKIRLVCSHSIYIACASKCLGLRFDGVQSCLSRWKLTQMKFEKKLYG